MAPQQNSTLIDENLECCLSLLNIPEEIIRYSPILPPKNKENLDKNQNNEKINKNNCHQHHAMQSIPRSEFTGKEQSNCYKNKHYRSRSRSVSLYGANSTVEQGHKEITIWLGDEARFVSGVTKRTTCNDIVKALIDDEMSNGNYEYCKRLKDGTVLRDYSDYVITECWRGIERSYDGNMQILPVWKAWSRVHNEIRLSLKHHKNIQDPVRALKSNTTLSSIRDYICKFLSFGRTKKCNRKSKKFNKAIKSKRNEDENQIKSNDVILHLKPDLKNCQKKYLQESCSKNIQSKDISCNTKPTIELTEIEAKTKLNKEKLYKLSETRSSIRKRRSATRRTNKKFSHGARRDSSHNRDANSFLRKRKDSSIRSSVRNKLSQKNAEMNQLYEREYALTRQLTNKCKMYKRHNQLYTTCDRNLEISVGQIQQSIEACAREIIQTEHELLKVKNEIKNDISIIYNLKRLTLDTDANACDAPNDLKTVLKPQLNEAPTPTATLETTTNLEHMLFVDNIYEFCDNNASMLV